MKKINLRGISEILSEKELKNVMGGSGTVCGYITDANQCSTGSCPQSGGRCTWVAAWGKCQCASVGF